MTENPVPPGQTILPTSHLVGDRAFVVPDDVKHLDVIGLTSLTKAFADWRAEARTEAARRSRGRMWFIFALLRYTGARLGEVLALDDTADFDFDRRIVRFRGEDATREVELPVELAEDLTGFLKRPCVSSMRGRVFHLDQAQVRRKFQEMADVADIPRELANPATLRRSRAIELLRGGVPLLVVQGLLGHGTADLTANFVDFSEDDREKIVRNYLEQESKRATSARNTFYGKVTNIRRGDIQAEVELTCTDGRRIMSIITMGSLRGLGLKADMLATAIVKAPLVILARAEAGPSTPPPFSLENRLYGTIESLRPGRIMTEAMVRINPALTVCAILTSRSARELELCEGGPAWAMFDAQSVILTLG